jgi:hypothetical protein
MSRGDRVAVYVPEDGRWRCAEVVSFTPRTAFVVMPATSRWAFIERERVREISVVRA